jgi:hypothetical protein
VRPVAVVQRYAVPRAAPSLDAASEALHGRAARQGAPLPEALPDGPLQAARLGGPSQVVVPPVGQPVQLLPLVGHGLFLLVGQTNRCSARSRRHQEKTLQGEHRAEAWLQLPRASLPGDVNAQA